MLEDHYDVKTTPDVRLFEFDSVGPKGTVRKIVRYSEINLRNTYNLGFGDKDEQTGFISDLVVTNNNDSQKVLATVAATLYAFTDVYPEAIVIATGSTAARTRLYRMGITTNLKAIEQDFIISGLTNEMGAFSQKRNLWSFFSAPEKVNLTYHEDEKRKRP